MRSSKGDILDGQCLKDVGEVFVLPVTRCRLSTVKEFSNSGSVLCGYCVIERACLVCVRQKPSATQLSPLALHFALETIHM